MKYCHLSPSPSPILFFLLFHEPNEQIIFGLLYLDLFFIDKVDLDAIFSPQFDESLQAASSLSSILRNVLCYVML